MRRLRYLATKTRSAWFSGTLRRKAIRFLATGLGRPLQLLMGYSRLSAADRRLNVRDGCADHRQESHHSRGDPEHIRRIVAAYRKSKEGQDRAAPPFRVRGLWAEWLAINYQALTAALDAEDPARLMCLLENLFREPFSLGIGGYEHYRRSRSLLGPLYFRYVWSGYRDKLQALGVDPRTVNAPLVGNPVGVLLDGRVVPIDALRHAYHAAEICELLRDVPAATCVEVGSGFGGQAFQTVRMGGDRLSKFVLFDVPEVAVISSYYLLSAFPGRRVRLFGEGPLSVSVEDDYDLAVFPHYVMGELPDLSVDLFYNSCSFAEMDSASSREYLSIIERTCRKYFLHDNHDTTLEFRYPDGSRSTNIIGSALIPNPATFKRVFKKPRVHGLPEDRSFVHFEYLYERM